VIGELLGERDTAGEGFCFVDGGFDRGDGVVLVGGQ
jgi:hypothetical protein